MIGLRAKSHTSRIKMFLSIHQGEEGWSRYRDNVPQRWCSPAFPRIEWISRESSQSRATRDRSRHSPPSRSSRRGFFCFSTGFYKRPSVDDPFIANTTFNHNFTCRANIPTLSQIGLWTALKMECLPPVRAGCLSESVSKGKCLSECVFGFVSRESFQSCQRVQ